MSEYSLSVVQVCPDAYKGAANAIAEAAGYGPDNLSVKLVDQDGGVWWGCHAWWIEDRFHESMNLDNYTPEVAGVLSQVVSSYKVVADPSNHWEEVLENLGLRAEEM